MRSTFARSACGLAAAALLAATPAWSQQPTPPQEPAAVTPTGAPGAATPPAGAAPAAGAPASGAPATTGANPRDPAAAAAAAATAEAARLKAEAEQKKQQRLQKIQQVRFDRRATTILRTWATPGDAVVSSDAPPPEAGAAAASDTPKIAGDPAVQSTASSSRLVRLGTPGPVSSTPALVPVTVGAPAAAGAPPAATATPPGAASPGAGTAAGTATPAVPLPDPFDLALKQWARAVTLGDWATVKTLLAALETPDEKKAAWGHMLNSLRNPPQAQGQQQPGGPVVVHFFSFDDVLGILDAAPLPRDDAAFDGLGAILRMALQRGLLARPLLERLRATSTAPEGQRLLTTREAAKLLFGGGLLVEAGEFLPPVRDLAAASDFEGLNLQARHFVARNQAEGKTEYLEQAWAALQELFAAPQVEGKQKTEALKTAVGLAPRLRQELGKTWLDASFTRDVQRGMDIIASIGVAAAESAQTQAQNASFRQLTLQLQKTAVDALLAASPQRAAEWRVQLSILADNWLREAQASYRFDQSTSYSPMMRRDRFGNFFYNDDDAQQAGRQALAATDVLDLRPDERWLGQLEPGMQPKFAMTFAQLWLKVQEEEQAFPHIRALAKTHPKQAKELVDEFLRVWTRNHDPNAGRHNYYFYGYESRSEGIPLTRSKQERNLADLSRWIEQLRQIEAVEPDQDLLATAFTTCHSSAEVYRLDAIQRVFGSLDQLKPRTLAALAQRMRTNLGGLWRQPAVQEKARTRRKQKDIETEVLRGYEVAQAVVADALQQHADDCSLLLARATLRHDENDYRREIGNDVEFAARRLAAFSDFAAAAAAYELALPDLTRQEETTAIHEHWFYAALGSSDLQNVSHEHVPVQSQVLAVRDSLRALPGDAAERHVARFANALFTRMGGLNPAVKMRYVAAGLEIVGDHKQAFEARKLHAYYKDIVGEIQLSTRVDGPTAVGHGEPFGLFVELRHTREIERESGGFGRYLRNQNDVSYSYNYGRPTENYREKFSDMARQALGEHFEVLSVTFQTDAVHSRATEQYGWRVTPYAYLLLKPRGPQVDRVPPLRLDLDFLDTSGYAVLPIESPVLPIDASAPVGAARPVADLEITQILDERQASAGKLLLEVKVTAHGLPPRFEDVLDLRPAGFDVAAVDDSGAMVARFDPDASTDTIAAERTWNVTLKAVDGLPERPRQFTFGTSRVDGTKMVLQRYADADLVAATPTIDLLADYGEPRPLWPWLAGGGVAALLLIAAGLQLLRRRAPAAVVGLRVPDDVTPFTVLGLLRQIQASSALDASGAAELQTAIERIEAGYFATTPAEAPAETPDLRALATEWVARAGVRSAG